MPDVVNIAITPRRRLGDPFPLGALGRRVIVRLDFDTIDHVMRLLNLAMRDYGERGELLVVGWKTYHQLCLFASEREISHAFFNIDTFQGVKVLMDPALENFARVILPRRLIGHVREPLQWYAPPTENLNV